MGAIATSVCAMAFADLLVALLRSIIEPLRLNWVELREAVCLVDSATKTNGLPDSVHFFAAAAS